MIPRSLVRAYFGLVLALEEKAVRAEVPSGLEQHVHAAKGHDPGPRPGGLSVAGGIDQI